MTLRTILVAVSGGSASAGAVDAACRLAKRFGAHVEALHVRVDEREALLLYGDGFGAPLGGDLLDRIAADAAAAAANAKRIFDEAVARFGLPLYAAPPAPGANKVATEGSAVWREEIGIAPEVVARRGRLFDLIVLGRSERAVDEPHSNTVEETLLKSGRPVLLAPAVPPAKLDDTIALGWNGSVEAVRALVAAMPFLARAQKVRVITVGTSEAGSGAEAVEYLAWHDIAATAVVVPRIEGVGPGEQVLAAARDEGAGLLVMGGYGHKPWRELLFGGATREVIGTSLLPLLLAH